jgi:(1->4)-alpha-D-glucan 1-alpha-D-glucosylmutase
MAFGARPLPRKYVAKLNETNSAVGSLALCLQPSAAVHTATTKHSPRIPLATYRLQFNTRFTFRDARAIVGYLQTLGVSDCYASSYLRAVPGSGHGYDMVDPTRLNPEIGSDEEYWAWIGELKARGMGHVLDVVPNHMGIARSANPWWLDVLENGPSSRFARFFDIDWHPVKTELADKVLIPILGDQYGAVLERQELRLAYREGAFVVEYGDDSLPVAPDTFGRILSPGFDGWLTEHPGEVAAADADELRSIMTSAANLPARSSRDQESIALRAREKEVVKRRLTASLGRSAPLRAFVDAILTRFNGIVGQPRSFDLLDDLLKEQSYRLAHWRVASEEINYRRFFDVNQLAALRMEDPEVFEEVHRCIFTLVGRGAATGLRIDHVDGLFAPGEYLRRLQAHAAAALDIPGAPPDLSIFLIVEKILGPDEQLPPEWPVHGTTGYEFAAVVNNLFVDTRNERAFDDIYARFIREQRRRLSFDDLVYRSKKLVMHETMSGDINSLGHQLNCLSERHRHFRDFTLYSLIATLKEVIACFPVYRTYVTAGDPVSEHDRRFIDQAVRAAKRRAPGVGSVVLDFIKRLLLKQTAFNLREDCEELARFIGKFQQITSPVAAKAIEDSALYAHNRLLSLNEVGSDPTRFGVGPEEVHRWMADRRTHSSAALSTTSTHDTKRGEDVRARLNVLSELPAEWKSAVAKWRTLNQRLKSQVHGALVPAPNEEYLIYQTLVGAWPFDPPAEPAFRERLRKYFTKALREAKVNTSWLSPDEEYEADVLRFVDTILDRASPFMQAFLPFQARVAELGIYNSLAQLLIKIAAPGIPDFYQGTELWDLSLVDPDNRRPVDYALRRRWLEEIACEQQKGEDGMAMALLDRRTDGRVKLFVMVRALHARARMRAVFEHGDYAALDGSGSRRDCVFAFARRLQGDVAIACVPRFVASLVPDAARAPLGGAVWGDTRIEVPDDMPALRDVFTGNEIPVRHAESRASIEAATVFQRFPVALLVPSSLSPAGMGSRSALPTSEL